ncbi:MAG TPA: zinc ribbon domain-containing protein, partial [Thermoleophilaceae bacterium]
PYCDYEVERSFLRCPNCMRRLKEPCATCGKPLDPRWKICPYCEAEVGQPAAEGRRPRRRPAAAAAAGSGVPPRPAPRQTPRSTRPAEAGGERPTRVSRERPPSAS